MNPKKNGRETIAVQIFIPQEMSDWLDTKTKYQYGKRTIIVEMLQQIMDKEK